MGGAQHAALSGGGQDQDGFRCRNWSGGNSSWGKHSRSQAYMFRKSNEFKRIIHIVGVDGNCSRIKVWGQMNITNHRAVLQALLFCSQRFSMATISDKEDGSGQSWSLDKTGTINTSGLTFYGENDAEQQEIRETLNIPVPDEVLQVHGYAPLTKAEGTVRLIYENVNRINNRMCNTEKLEKKREIHNELEVDIAAYRKHQLNMKNKNNCNGFNQLFKGGEEVVHSVVTHNVHENFGKVQQGGTSLIMFGPLTDQLDFNENGKDNTGLGRWSVMTVQGDGARMRIVCGYNPCSNSKLNSSTTYQQHRRYFVTQQKDPSCPRVRFRQDLVKVLTKWREKGDRLIISMDANEDIYKIIYWWNINRQRGAQHGGSVWRIHWKENRTNLLLGLTTNQWDLDHNRCYCNACLRYAHGIWGGRPPSFCNRHASSQSHWRGTSQGTAVYLETIKHKGFKQSNQELSGPPGGQSCTMTPPYRTHGGVT
jgi:hypothetical protein